MKIALLILLIICSLISLCIFGYDFFVYSKEKYSCFHIGRWKSTEEWKKAITKVTKKWALKTPVLRLKNDCRYLLIDRIRGTYGKTMVQSWQKAGCILGLEEAVPSDLSETLSNVKKQLISSNGDWKIPVEKIDYAMLAYALLKNEESPQSIKPAMDSMIACIESNICGDGLISYSGGTDARRRYVDTIGFVCPFLALCSKVYKEPKYVKLAVNQFRIYRNHGMLGGLPVHCFNAESGLPAGIYGWGRGTGWYTLGLIDMFSQLEKDDEDYAYCKDLIKEIADICAKFERTDGGFASILTDGGRYDSSATAMLGYFYARCAEIFENDAYAALAKRCMKRLMSVTKFYGVVNECQGDTIDIGIFSQRYQEMPFVQGMTLRLASLIKD